MADDREEGTTGLVAPGPLRSPLTRRTLLGGAAVVIGGAALAACTTGGNASDQGATAAGTTSLLKKIQDRGQLNVTTSLLYPPEFFKDKNGQPAGYDIDGILPGAATVPQGDRDPTRTGRGAAVRRHGQGRRLSGRGLPRQAFRRATLERHSDEQRCGRGDRIWMLGCARRRLLVVALA